LPPCRSIPLADFATGVNQPLYFSVLRILPDILAVIRPKNRNSIGLQRASANHWKTPQPVDNM
jgi:hypothetical protein